MRVFCLPLVAVCDVGCGLKPRFELQRDFARAMQTMHRFLLLAMWTVPVPCRGTNKSAERGVGPMISSLAGTGTGADYTPACSR